MHYFDYLRDDWRTCETRARLIDSWITGNPIGREDAWEPFPVSLRIVNWIEYFLSPVMRPEIRETWLRSLNQQALWLEKNIEYHLLANHFFKNLKIFLITTNAFFKNAKIFAKISLIFSI